MFDRNIISKALFIAVLFSAPVWAKAEVRVTEIAWMGTSVSANDEWIELYNSGPDTVSLSGWTLSSADGTPSITLSGSIGAGEYKLLERTDDTTYPGITALQIFTGALGNEGEDLSLKQGGTTVQSISFAGGWPAGDVATKKTMQWTGSSWVTATETGGSATTATADEDTGTDTTDDTGGTDEEEVDDTTDTEEEVVETTSASKSRPKRTVYEDMIFELDFPSHAIVGSPAKFSAQALDFDRTRLRRGVYIFNMGDGTTRTFSRDWNGDKEGFFYHTYEHAGTYSIGIQYYMTKFEDAPPDVEDHFTIEVTDPSILISKVNPDGSIEIKNSSAGNIDMSEWVLTDSMGRKFVMPIGTESLAGKTNVFSRKAIKIDALLGVTLSTSTGAFVASSITPKATPKLFTSSKNSIKPKEAEGDVLGIATVASSSEVISEEPVKEKDPNSLVWILLFVILVLLSVIAVMFLKREEKKEEYLLIDE